MTLVRRSLDTTLTAENSKVPARFHGMQFASQGSQDYLFIDQAVKYAAENGGVLQSLAEAAAIRVDNDGSVADANQYQLTRTVPLYFMADGKWTVAVTDSADAADNLLLARSAEAQEAFSNGRVLTLPSSDSLVQKMLRASEREGRTFALPASRQPYTVPSAAMGSDTVASAFFGDVASAYGNFLAENGRESATFYLLNNGLSQVGENMVGVRPVGLGVGYEVSAGGIVGGCARPVAPIRYPTK